MEGRQHKRVRREAEAGPEHRTTWHKESCRRPDVYAVDGRGYCGSCDAWTPSDQAVPASEPGPPLPEIPPGKHDHLTWPTSVKYWNSDKSNSRPSGGRVEEIISACSRCQHVNKVESSPRHLPPIPSSPESKEIYKTIRTQDQIRLLLLSKGSFDDAIHGTLMIAALSSGVSFQALSYTWADINEDDARSQIIFLGPKWEIFMVTANCQAALRRMRRPDRDFMVWVDAICINQWSPSERNHQVGLMQQIYNAASEVFVYLGEPPELEGRTTGSSEALERLMWAKEGQPIDGKGWQTLEVFFGMRFFQRIWVIQEIANAKCATIHYGKSVIGWSILELERLKKIGIDGIAPKWITDVYERREYSTCDLPYLMFSTFSSEATDPRDKLFALFGLLKDADKFNLAADYSLTLAEVQIGIAAFLLCNKDDCNILVHARGKQKAPDPHIPTWIPVWDRLYQSVPIPRGSTACNDYAILQAEHIVPEQLLREIEKPKIHHIQGHLTIQAIRLTDSTLMGQLGRLGFFAKYLNRAIEATKDIDDFTPGFALILDPHTFIGNDSNLRDEFVLLQGCKSIFHVQKDLKRGTFSIIGACNILLRLEAHWDTTISKSDIVTQFILQHLPLDRRQLCQIIELDILYKWLNGSEDSDINRHESMFSDSNIIRAFAAFTKGFNSEPNEPDSDSASSSPSFLSPTSQTHYLTTRLPFFHSPGTWHTISLLSHLSHKASAWRTTKYALEGNLYAWSSTKAPPDILGFKRHFRDDMRILAELTVDLLKTLLDIPGVGLGLCGDNGQECSVRFLGDEVILVKSSVGKAEIGASREDVKHAIREVLVGCLERREGFRKIGADGHGFVFEGWDWSAFEVALGILNKVEEGALEVEQLRRACEARMFLGELLARGPRGKAEREWEWITIT